jgi:ankyrin repeat protein
MLACEYGRLEIVQYLIKDCGAKIQDQNKDGETPLDIAKKCKNRKVVAYLQSFMTEKSSSNVSPANEGSEIKDISNSVNNGTVSINNEEKVTNQVTATTTKEVRQFYLVLYIKFYFPWHLTSSSL